MATQRASAPDDIKKPVDSDRLAKTPVKTNTEREPFVSKPVEMVEYGREADREVAQKIQAEIKEARSAQPEPELPSDVAASGVRAPAEEASGVIANGPSIELPITEAQYNEGLSESVSGSVSNKVVFGPKSIVGLVLWIGRKIKLLHAKGKKIIFRKKES